MLSTPNMGLVAWNLPTDPYNSEELAENFVKLDIHDHTNGKGALITEAAIADQAITAAKLHPDAINDTTISAGSIDTTALADNSVTSAKIVNGTIATADIGDGQVTTGKLAADAVTRAKTTKQFIQTKRAALAGVGDITVTWDVAFPDTNYTVAPLIEATSVSQGCVLAMTAKTTTQVTIDFLGTITGTIHLTGIHD